MEAPSISFSFLNNLTEGFRTFVVVSVVSSYGLVLYEMFPEYLFNLVDMLTYFAIPMGVLAVVLIGIPKMAGGSAPKAKPSTESKTGEDLLDEIVTGGGSQGLVQVQEGTNSEEKKEEEKTPEGEIPEKISADVKEGSAEGIDEELINDMIDQKKIFLPSKKISTKSKKT